MNPQPQCTISVHVLAARGMLMFLTLLLSGTKLYDNVRSSKRVWKPVLCPALRWFPAPLCLLNRNHLRSSFWSYLPINKHRFLICKALWCPLSSEWFSLAGIKSYKISSPILPTVLYFWAELWKRVYLWSIYFSLYFIYVSSNH